MNRLFMFGARCRPWLVPYVPLFASGVAVASRFALQTGPPNLSLLRRRRREKRLAGNFSKILSVILKLYLITLWTSKEKDTSSAVEVSK